jgi:hypothetical protein
MEAPGRDLTCGEPRDPLTDLHPQQISTTRVKVNVVWGILIEP